MFVSKLSSLECAEVTPWPSVSGLLTLSGRDLRSAVLWEPRPILLRIQPPGILEKSHFTKSAIHHPQTPGSVSPCQEQGQIFWVIGCRLCNLMPLSSWRQEVRWREPSRKRLQCQTLRILSPRQSGVCQTPYLFLNSTRTLKQVSIYFLKKLFTMMCHAVTWALEKLR